MHDDDHQGGELATTTPGPLERIVEILTGGQGRSSVEKVTGVADELINTPAETEQAAAFVSLMQAGRAMGLEPATILPSDPAELDTLLARGATLLLAARSDDAAALFIGEAGRGDKREP